MFYYIFTLGCQMNISDSQRIAQKLEDLGYKSAPADGGAGLVIINACSVRQTAVDRIWGRIKVWQNGNKKVFITGCVLPADKKKFLAKNIIFFNIQELSKLGKIIKHLSLRAAAPLGMQQSFDKIDCHGLRPRNDTNIALIPIMTGCDNFCSYCAVPYTRGREVSRPMEDVINDVQDALKNSFKEILLLGQNVNSFHPINTVIARSEATRQSEDTKDRHGQQWPRDDRITSIDNTAFINLLKTIDELPDDFQFNFISSNPHDMSDELIETFSKLKKWPRELHLAMQSGDDEILKKMNRKYTSSQYLALISKLKNQISNIILTTDIIVGFPDETKKQFENTVKICQKIGFQKAYISQYSPRPGTAAAKLKDNVPKAEKKRRWLILDRLINQ